MDLSSYGHSVAVVDRVPHFRNDAFAQSLRIPRSEQLAMDHTSGPDV